MSTQPCVPGKMKSAEALKAAAIIIGLLLGCILILWTSTRVLRSKEPDPAPNPAPAR